MITLKVFRQKDKFAVYLKIGLDMLTWNLFDRDSAHHQRSSFESILNNSALEKKCDFF